MVMLILLGNKRQDFVALSTTEARYVADVGWCAQLLWIKHQREVLRVAPQAISILCAITSALTVAKNSVHHKMTKHIDVRHHFLRDHVEKGNISL
ncbi:hypothetical protein KY284_025771 [Solanum tuberosum]|nr:hypothetical protein KY284_025771 [Solanum tuberosum]